MDTTGAEVQVHLQGNKTVTVHVPGNPTVQEAIDYAAKHLGTNVGTTQVDMFKNGQQVNGNAPLADGDVVTTATRVANG